MKKILVAVALASLVAFASPALADFRTCNLCGLPFVVGDYHPCWYVRRYVIQSASSWYGQHEARTKCDGKNSLFGEVGIGSK